MTPRSRLVESIRRASAFLIERRDPDGLWREFDLVRGTSDEWVSAYIGLALAGNAQGQDQRTAQQDPEVAQSVVEILWDRRNGTEGWGYSASAPPDADSTAWVSRLAHIAGHADAYARGIRYLKRCLSSNGGVATYESPVAIRRFLGDPPISLRGWCSAHVCVTAAVSWFPEIACYPAVRKFLRDAQLESGNWLAYWWTGSAYATSLAVEAMRQWSDPEDQGPIARAAEWATSADQEDSPWGMACRIAILSDTNAATANNLAERLMNHQQSDGSWPSSARLRIPPPHATDASAVYDWIPDGKGFSSVNLDHNRLFTTATALRSLRLLL